MFWEKLLPEMSLKDYLAQAIRKFGQVEKEIIADDATMVARAIDRYQDESDILAEEEVYSHFPMR